MYIMIWYILEELLKPCFEFIKRCHCDLKVDVVVLIALKLVLIYFNEVVVEHMIKAICESPCVLIWYNAIVASYHFNVFIQNLDVSYKPVNRASW